MMDSSFRAQILGFSNLEEIDGAWVSEDYSALLESMEFGDQAGLEKTELRDMCIMSLQDLEPEEAAYLVLNYRLGDVLRDGQIHNAAHEMLDEKLWEEYVDPKLHESMFNVGSLLFQAFPRLFPEPDAVQVKLEVTAANAASKALLFTPLDESFLLRLLADGMDGQSVLYRLYGEQLQGKSFPNAEDIVWIVRTQVVNEDTMQIEVIGSGYWLDALRHSKSFNSAAYADETQSALS
ncbi:MAG: hypothetical protein HKN11_17515 [Rhizobiales bacterium]|nr:hypothetical protein [Hyphomicrobiales bacterium]